LWRVLYWTALIAMLVEAIGLTSNFAELRRRHVEDASALAPDQIAAVVRLWPSLDGAQREDVLAAISWAGLRYRATAQGPVAAPGDMHVRAIENAVRKRLVGAPADSVEALIRSRPGSDGERPAMNWALSSEPVRIYVRVAPDAWLVAEVRGELGARFLGLPTGFWVGVIGLLLAGGVLFAILREGRAIERIARSVEAFARTGTPQPFVGGGSPEVARLAKRIADMERQVAVLLKERTVALGAIAHDIKTYIQRLKLRLDLLDDPSQVEKAARDLDAMNTFVEDALLVAVHASPLTVRETVDLLPIAAHEVEAARMAGGRITLDHEGGPFTVVGDPSALSRALANVIGNAFRYGKEARLSVRGRDRMVEVIIDDRGPGIPAAERQAVFAAFYRGDASRNRETGGTGLGLAITSGIVAQHGGSIEIEDAPGGGARIRIALPLASHPRKGSAPA
jgi:two-component system osmolarity sensor histidine kinase EnvZ